MERVISEIDREIEALEKELATVKGTDTEVYTRIVGYHRALSNWNKGKREEYNHRVAFDVLKSLDNDKMDKRSGNISIDINESESFSKYGDVSRYIAFYSQYCRNCQPVKDYISNLMMKGDQVDVSSELGLDVARKYGVTATPTVIMLDNDDNVIAKLLSKEELVAFIEKAEEALA